MEKTIYKLYNKEQELKILNYFELKNFKWSTGLNPTEQIPSKQGQTFPYFLTINKIGEIKYGCMKATYDSLIRENYKEITLEDLFTQSTKGFE